MKLIINGIAGRMGEAVLNAAKKDGHFTAIIGVDKIKPKLESHIPVFHSFKEITNLSDYHIIIDFSVRNAIYDILPYAKENNIGVVLATTGYTTEDLEYIESFSNTIPIFKSGNMSIGINTLIALAEHATKLIGKTADIEIIEQHHNQKIDAPSGTALMLYDSIDSSLENKSTIIHGREGIIGKRTKNEIGMHAIRGGSIIGKHEILFALDKEVISLKHEAEDRTIFANGSIAAAKFLINKQPRVYSMRDMLA